MKSKVLGAALFVLTLAQLYYFEQHSPTSGLKILFWPAILVTLIGPLGLLLLCTDTDQMRSWFDFVRYDSIAKSRNQLDTEYVLLKQLARDYYAKGIRAFDGHSVAAQSVSPWVLKTIERLSVRVPFADVADFLLREQDSLSSRLSQTVSLATLGGRLAPSVGMLGTIIGMSQLLGHLRDPENIGSSMSVALLTTFYGLFFSLALWTPMQQHLQRLFDLKMKSFDQVTHWLELLQERKPSDYFVGEDRRNQPTVPSTSPSSSLGQSPTASTRASM
jgi:flagellar motor component MotA